MLDHLARQDTSTPPPTAGAVAGAVCWIPSEARSEAMNLADYERTKFELAEALRTLRLYVSDDVGGSDPEWLRELFVRLAEDRFNLVVIGRFSRGKTTLMNAILGMDRLPVGIVPLTSVITSVEYGSKECAVIRYQDRLRLSEEIPLAALPDYITQQHNPGNARRVRMAEVRLPADILRRGFHFVDTPGLGSSIPENTRTTEAFLPEADAFVLVTSFESPLSEDELRILREIAPSARRIFVVVNKQDMATMAERIEALSFVREQLAATLDNRSPPLFPVSARQALAARLAGDDEALAASGVPAFEEELTRFLLADKLGEFLLRMCDRIAERIGSLPPSAEVARLADTVQALSRRIAEVDAGAALRTATSTGAYAASGTVPKSPSCAICARVAHASFEFLRHFQYQLSISPELQRAHAERGGFCPQHTWEYGTLASSQGFCISNPPLLERLAGRFLALAESGHSASTLADDIRALLPTGESCPLCAEQARAESEAIAAFAARMNGAPTDAPGSLPVVCIPHLRLLAAVVEDAVAMRRLMAREAAMLDRLAEDMRRYATKRDAIRSNLLDEEEINADQRAMIALAGLRHVNPAARGGS
jgi:small GTP-binding protein